MHFNCVNVSSHYPHSALDSVLDEQYQYLLHYEHGLHTEVIKISDLRNEIIEEARAHALAKRLPRDSNTEVVVQVRNEIAANDIDAFAQQSPHGKGKM